jgi:hypothetical protein
MNNYVRKKKLASMERLRIKMWDGAPGRVGHIHPPGSRLPIRPHSWHRPATHQKCHCRSCVMQRSARAKEEFAKEVVVHERQYVRTVQSVPPNSLGAGNGDPFSSTAVKMTPAMNETWRHCESIAHFGWFAAPSSGVLTRQRCVEDLFLSKSPFSSSYLLIYSSTCTPHH